MSVAGMLPHQVEIIYDFEGAGNGTVCLGSIISSYLVLTVATCLAGRNESLFKIRANGKNQNESQIRTIDHVFSYAALDSEASPFDVAVISLNSELELDKNHTSEIPYARTQIRLFDNSTGEIDVCFEDGSSKVATLAPSGCSQNSTGKAGEEGNFICVEPFENVTESSQLPLAGSSLICSGVLHGLFATNSSTEGETRGKRAYTSVTQYSHWIELVVDAEEEADDLDVDANLEWLGNETAVPYQLSIRLNGSHHCGGVILDKKTALSAAHCFDPKESGVASFNLSSFSLYAGEQSLNESDSTEQIFQIDKFFKHPKYKNVLEGNDIAVIQIKGEFNFTERVNNIWISSQNTPNSQDENRTELVPTPATGWKKTRIYGQPSPVLQSVDLELLEKERCKKKWPFLTDPMICGYNNVSNMCKGDSGGPLVIQNYEHAEGTKKDLLVGIASFGPIECQKPDMPNGFTNVSSFYAWIAKSRSNSLCSSSQFQCFNGDCIQKEMRCDKKYDCADGSDEKICRPLTRGCGGLIKVVYSHEITWQAPNSHPHPDSSCLWLVANRNGDRSNTEIQILNDTQYEFDPASSELYILNNLTGNELPTSLLTKVDLKYDSNQPFFALYFRTNSTRPNNGIYIKMIDKSESSNQTLTQVQGVVLKGRSNSNLKPNSFSPFSQTFSFVNSESSKNLNNNSSLEDENLVVLLKPVEAGGRIQARLDSLQMAENGDSVDIISYSKNAQQLESLDRLHGAGNWSNRFYYGDENEPILMFFHAAASNKSKLMNLTYVERPKISCGGLLSLEDELEIVYQIPPTWNLKLNESRELKCVWTIRNLNGSSVNLTLFRNPSADFVAAKSSLSALYGFSLGKFSIKELDQKEETYKLETSFMTLIFRSNSSEPNTGFHLHLRNSDLENSSTGQGQSRGRGQPQRIEVKDIRLPPNATLQHFSYPSPPAKAYGSNERVFIIAQPRPGGRGRGRMQVTVTFVDTEAEHDWLSIITYRKTLQRYGTLFGYYGQARGSDVVYYGDEGEPLLIHFHSNSEVNFGGFQFVYSERPMAPVNNTCGGFINLELEHEIVYQVPSEKRGVEIHCIWIVANERGTTMEATLFDNQQAQFDPQTDKLQGLHAFNRGNFSTEKLSTSYKRYKIASPILILEFRSSPKENQSLINRGFHLLLKNPNGHNKNLTVQPAVQDIRLTPALNAPAQEFSYPVELELEPELELEEQLTSENETEIETGNGTYKDNERVFITIQPSQPGSRIQLNILAVDTEANFDWLDVLTKRKGNESFSYVFRFYGTGDWADKTFFGDEDEPFILYFHSDPGNVTTGFKISYFEIPKISICGGFIELEKERDIVYQLPAPERENQTPMSKAVCVWIIANKRGESMEATILNDPAALFHPADSQLLGLNSFKPESYLNELILKKNTTYEIDSPLMALYFRSTSNMSNGFHLRLRNPDYENGEEQSKVQDIRITPTENATKFSYPFLNDTSRNQLQLEEKVFVILEPSEPNMSVQVNLEGLKIEDGGGWLDLLMYSENQKILEIRYKTTIRGRINKQFESKKGEPLILYFHSYASAQPKPTAFKFTHSEKN